MNLKPALKGACFDPPRRLIPQIVFKHKEILISEDDNHIFRSGVHKICVV